MTRARRRKSHGIGLAIAIVAYLALATGAGLDRLAADRPELYRLVPEPLRDQALRDRATRFVEAGIPGSALEPATALVGRHPLGTESSALLGTARLAVGDTTGAERAFRVAARLGWRDARTQIYWLRAALALGDWDRAALRFGALARQWPHAPAIAEVATIFESSLAGRRALAHRIAAGETWAEAYAAPVAETTSNRLAGRAGVLIQVAQEGRKLGCEPVAGMVSALAATNAAMAAQLWRSHCAEAALPGTLTDSTFARAQLYRVRTPFEWQFPGDGAVNLVLVPSGRGKHVEVRNSGPLTLPVAAQQLDLGPGRYRLSWINRQSGGTVQASLSCRRERAHALPRAGSAMGGREGVILAFDGACAAPWVQLWIGPGSTASIATVELEPL